MFLLRLAIRKNDDVMNEEVLCKSSNVFKRKNEHYKTKEKLNSYSTPCFYFHFQYAQQVDQMKTFHFLILCLVQAFATVNFLKRINVDLQNYGSNTANERLALKRYYQHSGC